MIAMILSDNVKKYAIVHLLKNKKKKNFTEKRTLLKNRFYPQKAGSGCKVNSIGTFKFPAFLRCLA